MFCFPQQAEYFQNALFKFKLACQLKRPIVNITLLNAFHKYTLDVLADKNLLKLNVIGFLPLLFSSDSWTPAKSTPITLRVHVSPVLSLSNNPAGRLLKGTN